MRRRGASCLLVPRQLIPVPVVGQLVLLIVGQLVLLIVGQLVLLIVGQLVLLIVGSWMDLLALCQMRPVVCRRVLPSPTLSPTDPVPRGLLTLGQAY